MQIVAEEGGVDEAIACLKLNVKYMERKVDQKYEFVELADVELEEAKKEYEEAVAGVQKEMAKELEAASKYKEMKLKTLTHKKALLKKKTEYFQAIDKKY